MLNEVEILLIREASMSSMSLGIGLTLIRKYDFTQAGFFYSGMYSITTGIERLMKIILIYDHRLKNGDRFPDNQQLRNYSHRLETLFHKAVEINSEHQFDNDDTFLETDELYNVIIKILSDFAVQARYYNLDYVTGKQQTNKEPLRRWNEDVISVILNRHYKPKKEKLEQIKMLGKMLEPASSVRHTDESGGSINNITDLMLQSNAIHVKQKYSVYYLYSIVQFLCNLCTELEYKGNFFPYPVVS